MSQIAISLAQLNVTVGDIDNNLAKMLDAAKQAEDNGADLIVFSELVITAYPPEDLLFYQDFIEKSANAVAQYTEQTPNITSVISAPMNENGKLYNAALVTQNGKIIAKYFKQKLPNYGVFDEFRYFAPGNQLCTFSLKDKTFGITVCEDLWDGDVAKQYQAAGVDQLLSLNASPFEMNKREKRLATLRQRIKETALPIIYVNQVGGQDELVFDGSSMVLDSKGNIQTELSAFKEEVALINSGCASELSEHENMLEALVLATRDYVTKNKFKKALIGLSGGIDSALTLVVAVKALGAENVSAIMMPSRYTSDMSLNDAKALADTLKVDYQVIAMDDCFQTFMDTLAPQFEGLETDVTEQNIQARCRGVLLMALSNKLRKIVLTTGNRSEMAVGYATLYGDMAGGFAVLKDIYKTSVFTLCRHINQIEPGLIPQNIIDRPPSAELAEDQLDEDSLPPYDILDQILIHYLDEEKTASDIVKLGFDKNIVKKVIHLVDINEYKRRQSPPGVRINHKAFGRDRRYPITSSHIHE